MANMSFEVSEEDYQADLAAGIDKDSHDETGCYKMKRGGFLTRQPG